jgi:hypothetical protein
MRLLIVSLSLALLASCRAEEPLQSAGVVRQALDGGSFDGGMALSATRALRRLSLTLRGTEPTLAEYQAAQAAEQAGTFQAFYDAQVTSFIASPDFYDVMLGFGHDYLKVGDYQRGSLEGGLSAAFKGAHAAQLDVCPAGTPHAGKLFNRPDDRLPDGGSLPNGTTWCGQANAPVATVEPWWAPGTQVQVIGNAANPAATVRGSDCGRMAMGDTSVWFTTPGCGCGPNLLYCYPETRIGPAMYPNPKESHPGYAGTFRRLLHEEPARLFAHVATSDSSFADLITGDYTVAPRWLQFMYVRWGRMNTDNNAPTDSSGWFRTATNGWDRVQLSTLHPNLLASRAYTFDPRTNSGAPQGIPAAGVLTMLGPNSWYPRERVRAARFLEIFACKVFSAPDPNMVFTPPFRNDPKREGACQHCHASIEPAAIHFKRLEIEDADPKYGQGHANLAGIGVWQWRRTSQPFYNDPNAQGGVNWRQPYGRWNNQFIPDTFLTPSTAAQVMANPDARFLDFLPPGETLLGQTSDGTIGPLGFGKLVLASGEFDRCAVDRIFERVMGFGLTDDPNRETALVQRFVAGNRRVRPFIESLVKDAQFRRGR